MAKHKAFNTFFIWCLLQIFKNNNAVSNIKILNQYNQINYAAKY